MTALAFPSQIAAAQALEHRVHVELTQWFLRGLRRRLGAA